MSSLFVDTTGWHQPEHHMHAEAARRFFADELAPNIETWAAQGQVDRAFWSKAGAQGLMAGSVPEAYGGLGGGVGFDSVTLYEQAYTGDVGWGYGIQSIGIHYIAAYGSEEQKARWLPRMVAGEMICALAITEPDAGSDMKAIRTTALKDGNHYRINGSKIFITNGISADLIILVTKTDPDKGARGVSLIVVETQDLEGFRRGRKLEKLGMKGNDTAELFFDDARVPMTNLLGEAEGQGFAQLMEQLPWERLTIGINALGNIDYAINETVRYVQDRKAFGQRLMDMQNTRFKLAEAKTKAELLRTFVNSAIQKAEAGTLDAATASMVKYWGTEAQNWVMNECVQLHGGYGYMMEYPICRLYADARVQMIYGGANEIMKELIARSLDQ